MKSRRSNRVRVESGADTCEARTMLAGAAADSVLPTQAPDETETTVDGDPQPTSAPPEQMLGAGAATAPVVAVDSGSDAQARKEAAKQAEEAQKAIFEAEKERLDQAKKNLEAEKKAAVDAAKATEDVGKRELDQQKKELEANKKAELLTKQEADAEKKRIEADKKLLKEEREAAEAAAKQVEKDGKALLDQQKKQLEAQKKAAKDGNLDSRSLLAVPADNDLLVTRSPVDVPLAEEVVGQPSQQIPLASDSGASSNTLAVVEQVDVVAPVVSNQPVAARGPISPIPAMGDDQASRRIQSTAGSPNNSLQDNSVSATPTEINQGASGRIVSEAGDVHSANGRERTLPISTHLTSRTASDASNSSQSAPRAPSDTTTEVVSNRAPGSDGGKRDTSPAANRESSPAATQESSSPSTLGSTDGDRENFDPSARAEASPFGSPTAGDSPQRDNRPMPASRRSGAIGGTAAGTGDSTSISTTAAGNPSRTMESASAEAGRVHDAPSRPPSHGQGVRWAPRGMDGDQLGVTSTDSAANSMRTLRGSGAGTPSASGAVSQMLRNTPSPVAASPAASRTITPSSAAGSVGDAEVAADLPSSPSVDSNQATQENVEDAIAAYDSETPSKRERRAGVDREPPPGVLQDDAKETVKSESTPDESKGPIPEAVDDFEIEPMSKSRLTIEQSQLESDELPAMSTLNAKEQVNTRQADEPSAQPRLEVQSPEDDSRQTNEDGPTDSQSSPSGSEDLARKDKNQELAASAPHAFVGSTLTKKRAGDRLASESQASSKTPPIRDTVDEVVDAGRQAPSRGAERARLTSPTSTSSRSHNDKSANKGNERADLQDLSPVASSATKSHAHARVTSGATMKSEATGAGMQLSVAQAADSVSLNGPLASVDVLADRNTAPDAPSARPADAKPRVAANEESRHQSPDSAADALRSTEAIVADGAPTAQASVGIKIASSSPVASASQVSDAAHQNRAFAKPEWTNGQSLIRSVVKSELVSGEKPGHTGFTTEKEAAKRVSSAPRMVSASAKNNDAVVTKSRSVELARFGRSFQASELTRERLQKALQDSAEVKSAAPIATANVSTRAPHSASATPSSQLGSLLGSKSIFARTSNRVSKSGDRVTELLTAPRVAAPINGDRMAMLLSESDSGNDALGGNPSELSKSQLEQKSIEDRLLVSTNGHAKQDDITPRSVQARQEEVARVHSEGERTSAERDLPSETDTERTVAPESSQATASGLEPVQSKALVRILSGIGIALCGLLPGLSRRLSPHDKAARTTLVRLRRTSDTTRG